MSSDIVPPPPGMSRPEDSPAALPAHEATTPEEPRPATPATDAIPALTGSASADDLGLSLGQVSPDPLLEEYSALNLDPGASSATSRAVSADKPVPVSTSTSEHFVGLDLSAPPSSKAGSASARGKDKGKVQDEE